MVDEIQLKAVQVNAAGADELKVWPKESSFVFSER